jgi:predicted dehydrogenase
MTKSVLIIGYGRAGKRHKEIANNLGYEAYLYDPFVFPYQGTELLDQLLEDKPFEHAVICTPPDSHLQYIEQCLAAGLKVLCEKPLCGIGQLQQAKELPADGPIMVTYNYRSVLNEEVKGKSPVDSPVMVAYNYRYHPELRKLRGTIIDDVSLLCGQYRDNLPEWGLLLDHCSHDLDIVSSIWQRALEVVSAAYQKNSSITSWDIQTTAGHIFEAVVSHPIDRHAKLRFGCNDLNIDAPEEMYLDMWAAFLRGEYYPNLSEAIKTQELLEACYRLNEERNDDN